MLDRKISGGFSSRIFLKCFSSLLGIISLIFFSPPITKATNSLPKPIELGLISSFFSPFQCDGLVTRDVDLDLKVKCVGVKSHLVLR